MPRYQLLPLSKPHTPKDIVANDPSVVLSFMTSLGCQEADVLCEGQYTFSASVGRKGVWYIFQRTVDKRPERPPAMPVLVS